jgi:hypothetical protein
MKNEGHKIEAAGSLAEYACWFLGASFLLTGAIGGPDYLRYLDWGWAFALNDIFRINSELASPVGVPLSQWSHGPGLFYALPAFVHRLLQNTSPLSASILGDSLIAGWFAVLILWWSFNKILRDRLGSSDEPRLFWLGIAFLGTHMGYYSRSHGSESLALGCLSLFAFWTILPRNWRRWDVITAGMLAAILIIIRIQLAPYAILGVILAFYRFRQSTSYDRSMKSLLSLIMILGAIFAAATTQILLVNFWMTGSFLHSTHMFGNGVFKSLDFSNPEILSVLFHPWHGLFVYHPFYIIGVIAFLRRLSLASGKVEKSFLAGLGLAIALHVYLQAAWYCWWLGTGTFGMRGLSVLGLIFPLLIIDDYRNPCTSHRIRMLYSIGAVICAVWSYLLMLQGDTNLTTFENIVAAQWLTLCAPPTFLSLLLATGIGCIYLLFSRRNKDDISFERFCSGGLSFLILWWLFVSTTASSLTVKTASVAFIMALLCALRVVAKPDRALKDKIFSTAHLRIGVGILACFALISIIFLTFSVSTYDYIRGHKSVPITFTRQSPVYYPEVKECYSEYSRISGFEDNKERLRGYLMDIQ